MKKVSGTDVSFTLAGLRFLRYFVAIMATGLAMAIPTIDATKVEDTALLGLLAGLVAALGKFLREKYGYTFLPF